MKFIKINILLLLLCLFALNITAQTTTITGQALNRLSVPVTNVEITLTGNNFNQTTTTNAEGNYAFAEVPVNQDFSIEAIKEGVFLNGVSTFDMVIMNNHILGITNFETSDQYIAMDANQSGSNTAFDLVQIRQLILGITTELPNSPAWRVIVTTDLENSNFAQGGFNNIIETAQNFKTTTTPMTIDFTAIKIGDANGNAIPNE